jgi:hypothetical protein
MDSKLRDIIRIANREFQEFIGEVSQNSLKGAELRGAARRLRKVALRLKQVDRYLTERAGSATNALQSEQEFLTYAENLKALRGVLETLQSSLLAQKSSSDNVHANLRAASAWAASLRQTS